MANPNDIDPARLDLVRRPCPNCKPDWSRLASLARLALAVARADLDRERRQGEKGGAT